MFEDVRLDDRERALLAITVSGEGFTVLKRIAEAEVEKYALAVLNTDGSDIAKLKARHALAQAAGGFWNALIKTVNLEMELLNKAPKAGENLPDITEGILQ